MAFIAGYGIYSILLAKVKQKRILIAYSTILSLILFIVLDNKVKHFFIISQKVILNIAIIIVFYIVVLILLDRSEKGVDR